MWNGPIIKGNNDDLAQPVKRVTQFCWVPHCKLWSMMQPSKFYPFPQFSPDDDEETRKLIERRRELWKKNCTMSKILPTAKICFAHFISGE